MSVIFDRAIGELACSPDQSALFRAFLAHEQHARCVAAVGARRFFLVNPTTGKISAIGDSEPHRAIGLHN